jgi:hypothetical protein
MKSPAMNKTGRQPGRPLKRRVMIWIEEVGSARLIGCEMGVTRFGTVAIQFTFARHGPC